MASASDEPERRSPAASHSSSRASDGRRIWGTAAAGTYVCLVVLNFAFLYPILTAEVIPQTEWQVRMWLGSWI